MGRLRSADLDVEVDEELAATRGQQWRRDEDTGEWLMPPIQRAYLDWLLLPPMNREPRTKEQFAAMCGYYDTKPLYKIEQSKRFLEVWKREHNDTFMSLASMGPIWDSLYDEAVNGRGSAKVKAAELLLRAAELMKPPEVKVVRDETVDAMTDAELMALLDGADFEDV